MPKNSKIKVVDIDNNTLDTVTETIDAPMAETVESNIVESVEIPNDEEVDLLPKPKAKSKSRAKPKEPVQTDILNEVEIIKPKPKAKSRAKPKDEDVEFLDDEVEEVPVKAKAKAKSKAKLIPEEEPEIIDTVKSKAAGKVECPDCKRKVTQKSLTYSHKYTCIAAKSKLFQKESQPIETPEVTEPVHIEDGDTPEIRDFTPVNVVLPVKKIPAVSRLQMKQELKKERIKKLFVEAV